MTALGRCRSQATSSGVCPWPLSQCASLPASVVLPEPCRPASMITLGGSLASRSRRVSPPRMAMSSSLTILTTCWAGFSAPETSAPLARSLIRAMKPRTTGSATSASSSAMRISRAVVSMSASDSLPLPRRLASAPLRRSERVSNTLSSLPARCDEPGVRRLHNAPYALAMLTIDRLELAAELDRLVTLLPRLTPRGGLSMVAAATLADLERHGRGASRSSPRPRASRSPR